MTRLTGSPARLTTFAPLLNREPELPDQSPDLTGVIRILRQLDREGEHGDR